MDVGGGVRVQVGRQGEGLVGEGLGGTVLVVRAHARGAVEDEVELCLGTGEVRLGESDGGGIPAPVLGYAIGPERLPTRTARDGLVVGCGWPLRGGPTIGGRDRVGCRHGCEYGCEHGGGLYDGFRHGPGSLDADSLRLTFDNRLDCRLSDCLRLDCRLRDCLRLDRRLRDCLRLDGRLRNRLRLDRRLRDCLRLDRRLRFRDRRRLGLGLGLRLGRRLSRRLNLSNGLHERRHRGLGLDDRRGLNLGRHLGGRLSLRNGRDDRRSRTLRRHLGNRLRHDLGNRRGLSHRLRHGLNDRLGHDLGNRFRRHLSRRPSLFFRHRLSDRLRHNRLNLGNRLRLNNRRHLGLSHRLGNLSLPLGSVGDRLGDLSHRPVATPATLRPLDGRRRLRDGHVVEGRGHEVVFVVVFQCGGRAGFRDRCRR